MTKETNFKVRFTTNSGTDDFETTISGTDNQIATLAGNSICVPVLEHIFKAAFQQYPSLIKNIIDLQ